MSLNNIFHSTCPQPQAQISFSTNNYQSTMSNSPQSGLVDQYVDTTFLSPDIAAPGLWRARSDGGRLSHQHSKSEGATPYSPFSHSDFIACAMTDKQQFLHPTKAIPNISRDHNNRSSSGSRDRGIGGMGLHSAPGSSRPSPYPSPKASPLLGYHALPSIPAPKSLPVSSGMGRGRPVSMPAYGASSFGMPPGGIGEIGQQLNAGAHLTDMGSPLDNSTHWISSTSSVTVTKPNTARPASNAFQVSERQALRLPPEPVPFVI